MTECPTCKSTAPHLHPAAQHGGEVEFCADSFHLTPTPQNKPEYIRGVIAKQRAAGDWWPEGNALEAALNARS